MSRMVVDGRGISGDTGKKNYLAVVFASCVAAAILRSVIAYRGGIWADEGFFLLVVRSASWRSMIDFLRFHESHPPLFYALMRLWMSMTGNSDAAARLLPAAIGVAIVPAIYMVGVRLFSARVGALGAALGAISPALAEHSAQLRPYGLLPLLVLSSCYFLVVSVSDGGLKRWAGYVVCTLLLVYTHNWSWLVVFAQLVAVASMLFRGSPIDGARLARNWTLAWVVIAAAYTPWLTTFFFQLTHAGHGPIVVKDMGEYLVLGAYAIPAAIVMVFVGTPSGGGSFTVTVVALAVAVGVFALLQLRAVSPSHANDGVTGAEPSRDARRREFVARRVLLLVPLVAIVTAVALSPRTDLLLPRCLAMLSPLALLLLGRWFDSRWAVGVTGSKVQKVFAASMMLALVAISASGIGRLMVTPRSNAREVAVVLTAKVRQPDLLIIAPEWYAASVNHYYPATVEQIDYPQTGRSGMADFTDVFSRVTEPQSLVRLREQIVKARRGGRRVWLIAEREYLREIMSHGVNEATQYRQAGKFSFIRVHQIRDALKLSYGEPDTSFFVKGRKPMYDELLPFLYSPGANMNTAAVRTPSQ